MLIDCVMLSFSSPRSSPWRDVNVVLKQRDGNKCFLFQTLHLMKFVYWKKKIGLFQGGGGGGVLRYNVCDD